MIQMEKQVIPNCYFYTVNTKITQGNNMVIRNGEARLSTGSNGVFVCVDDIFTRYTIRVSEWTPYNGGLWSRTYDPEKAKMILSGSIAEEIQRVEKRLDALKRQANAMKR